MKSILDNFSSNMNIPIPHLVTNFIYDLLREKTYKHYVELTTLFETGIKTPIMQPIDGIEPMIGCLVSFESWIK